MTAFDHDSAETPGVLVEASDGRVFYLSEEDAKRFEVSVDAPELLRALMHAGRQPAVHLEQKKQQGGGAGHPPPAAPMASCRYMLHWLLTHNPHSAIWRQNSVTWMERCS